MVGFCLEQSKQGGRGPLISLPYACFLCLCGIPYGPDTKQFLLDELAPHPHLLASGEDVAMRVCVPSSMQGFGYGSVAVLLRMQLWARHRMLAVVPNGSCCLRSKQALLMKCMMLC